tara:strand:+ start:3211 stop:3831 length:621 start_codon:yes stop_codon:yes gene_type:complete
MATFLNTTVLSADVMAHPPIGEGSGFRKLTNLNPATFAAADRFNIEPGNTAVFELSAKGKNNSNEDVLLFVDKIGSINRQPVAQILFNSDEIVTSKKHHGTGQLFTYTLVTPDGTEIKHKHKHKHRPATTSYTFAGNTTIMTNFSGVDIYLKTASEEHEVVGANTSVKYTLTSPHNAAGRTIAAGLSSNQNQILGPEFIRKRFLGY